MDLGWGSGGGACGIAWGTWAGLRLPFALLLGLLRRFRPWSGERIGRWLGSGIGKRFGRGIGGWQSIGRLSGCGLGFASQGGA